jgi:hypothetical protein
MYENLYKPALVFDGCTILGAAIVQKIGITYKGIGKG